MKKYVTVDKKNTDGLCYRKISDIMTEEGDKMNHMTVKNIVTRGFAKIADNIAKRYDYKYKKEEIYKIAQTPNFQLSIIEIMRRENNEK